MRQRVKLTHVPFVATETIVVRSKKQLDALAKALNSAEMIAFDVETTGLDKISDKVVGICLAVAPTQSVLHSNRPYSERITIRRGSDEPLCR